MANKFSREKRLQWFKNARFGKFIHWGLYTATDMGSWVMHDMEISAREYIDKLEPKFTGAKFDAGETGWLQICGYVFPSS